MARTLNSLNFSTTSGLCRTAFSFTLQVRHHSAVKSINTTPASENGVQAIPEAAGCSADGEVPATAAWRSKAPEKKSWKPATTIMAAAAQVPQNIFREAVSVA